jgi:hypothetical protein
MQFVSSFFRITPNLYRGLELHLAIELTKPDSVRGRAKLSLKCMLKYVVIPRESNSDANITSHNLGGFHRVPPGV